MDHRADTTLLLDGSEESLRTLAATSPEFIVFANRAGTIEFINRAIPPQSVEQLLGTHVLEHLAPALRPAAQATIDRVLTTGEIGAFHVDFDPPGGGRVTFETRIGPLRRSGQIVGVAMISRDVTSLLGDARPAPDYEPARATMINTADDGVLAVSPIDADPFLHFWQWNARMEEITGYSLEEINRLGWYRTIFSDTETRERSVARMREMLEGKQLQHEPWWLTRKDGTQRLTSVSTSQAARTDGSTAIVALVRDITERHQWEEALRASQREREILIEAIPDMIVRVRRDGTCLQYKPPREFEPWQQVDPAAVIGKHVRNFLPPSMANLALDAIEAAIATQQPQHFQFSLTVRGELRHREARLVPVGDDEALIILRDITSRRRAEQERDAYHRLTESIRKIQTRFISDPPIQEVFDSVLAEALALTDSQFGFVAETRRESDGSRYLQALAITNIAWDDATRKLYEERAEQAMLFRNLNSLFGAVLTENRTVIANDPAHDPRRCGLPAGHPPLTAFLGVPLTHEGETIGVIGLANRPVGYSSALVEHLSPFWSTCSTLVAAYLSERQRRDAEMRLAHSSRLNTVGEMAAGLAHEITQPLGAISNFAAAAATTLASNTSVDYDRLLQWNHKIIEQASRAGQIIDRLRRFAQRHEPVREPHLLGDIVTEAIALVDTHARRHLVHVQFIDKTNQLVVIADRVQIEQVIVNLLSNAIEAVESGEESRRAVTVRISAEPQQATISVDDLGPGLPAANAEPLFEPFFTTKPHGMGLGLTICRTIVQAHGGTIGAAPRHPHGASFFFTLPRTS